MIRKRGLTKHDVFTELEITRPTLIKLLEDINLLNGHQRVKLASILGLPIDVIDGLINLKEKEVDNVSTEIINLINTIENDKVRT